MKVEFYSHSLGQDEIDSLIETLSGVFLTAGPATARFEKHFAEYLGVAHVVGVSSGTAALFLCLKALGIGHGDEVITTPMTFVATSNAIIEAGAKPVFVDVETTTGNINADLIEAAITEKTKAIIPVHLYGQMCDMHRIKRIADQYSLAVIEDSAHCVEREGIRPGQLSNAACFSFYATKNITSGERGAIAINDGKLASKPKVLRLHGMNKEAISRYTDTYRHWDMIAMGYKANMFDIQAALLLPQIPKLEERLKRRAEIWQAYDNGFADLKGIERPKIVKYLTHARHLYTIWVDSRKRDTILLALQKKGIGVVVNYRAVHLLYFYRKTFGYLRGSFPVAERIGDQTITLPLNPSLSDDEVEKVIRAVREVAT